MRVGLFMADNGITHPLLKNCLKLVQNDFFLNGLLISGDCNEMAETARFELAVSQNGTTP